MTILLMVAKVTLVLLLALLAIEVMRKGSAASRHLVLGASLMVPALGWMVPAWEVVPRRPPLGGARHRAPPVAVERPSSLGAEAGRLAPMPGRADRSIACQVAQP